MKQCNTFTNTYWVETSIREMLIDGENRLAVYKHLLIKRGRSAENIRECSLKTFIKEVVTDQAFREVFGHEVPDILLVTPRTRLRNSNVGPKVKGYTTITKWLNAVPLARKLIDVNRELRLARGEDAESVEPYVIDPTPTMILQAACADITSYLMEQNSVSEEEAIRLYVVMILEHQMSMSELAGRPLSKPACEMIVKACRLIISQSSPLTTLAINTAVMSGGLTQEPTPREYKRQVEEELKETQIKLQCAVEHNKRLKEEHCDSEKYRELEEENKQLKLQLEEAYAEIETLKALQNL